MKKMNLPNKLTIFRIILIVPFVVLLLGKGSDWGWYNALFGGIWEYVDYISLVIFIIASMDPLADKLLVCSALIALVEMGRIPSWIVIVIISREFIISGFRLVAADNGVVIAASYWGKFKTTFQMVMVCLMIANIPQLQILTDIVMWAALLLTVISLIDYLWKNKGVMGDQK